MREIMRRNSINYSYPTASPPSRALVFVHAIVGCVREIRAENSVRMLIVEIRFPTV